MNLVHSKPFNVEHAKAGAPYCCANGDATEIFKWDCRGANSLAGIQSNASGDWCAAWAENLLVMLPLGTLDGKPVFTGDALEMRVNGTWNSGIADPKNRAFINCRWPELAKVYPASLMGLSDALDAKIGELPAGWTLIANAALKHAIDAGQVVIAADRDARDSLVARAIHDACIAIASCPRRMHDDINVEAIIATVPK